MLINSTSGSRSILYLLKMDSIKVLVLVCFLSDTSGYSRKSFGDIVISFN